MLPGARDGWWSPMDGGLREIPVLKANPKVMALGGGALRR